MPEPRQIVFIMTDTQRTDMLGCYGFPDMKTPHLDRLAAGGVRFDRAYTCQPVCGPARSALFTGTWPHTNGSWGNSMPLVENVRTVGQRLRDAGVHAAYIGKWHLDAGDYFGMGRCPDGWDPAYWFDMRCYLDELSPADRLRSRRMETTREGVSADFTFGHRCSNRAIDFLSKHEGKEFCLIVSYDEPHHPFVCPQPYAEMYRDYEYPKSPNVWDRLENKPAHQRAWAGGELNRDRDALKIRASEFLGCNSFVDSEIGRVIDAIDRHAPGALVIYTSDHGDMMNSHCLGGGKGPAAYDEITRIPLIVRWPGKSPAGAVGPHPVSHIDVVPTMLDCFGLPTPKTLEGRSMLSSFTSPQTRANDAVFIEFGRFEIDHDGFGAFQPMRAAFDGRYKLAINLLCEDELYDLHADPQEMTNLINSPAHAVARDGLHDRLLDWMNQTRDPFRGYYWERRPWRTDARPATWAYTGMTRQREGEADGEPRQLDYDTGSEIQAATRKKL